MWVIGSIELEGREQPRVMRLSAPSRIKFLPVPGWSEPLVYSLGSEATSLVIQVFVLSTKAGCLYEQARNSNLHPLRVVCPYDYEGYYYIRQIRREQTGGLVRYETVQMSLYRVGSCQSHVSGFDVSTEKVTNDWGI